MPRVRLISIKPAPHKPDDTSILTPAFPTTSWTPYIYTTSTPPEPGYLVAPTARGREAVPYLDFIVTHYDRLPTYMAFIHAAPKQWHNDILGRHTLPILQNLHLDSVARLGYLNLRCTHEPGCPVSVNPHAPTEIDVRNGDIRASFVDVYMQIFGVAERELVPQHVGGVCCAQFAVSRERVLQRPREEYARMLDWAVNGVETDSFGVGWVFEKVWHIVFGMEAE